MNETLARLNFRDIGGLPTVDGGQTRSGVLYRSEGPKNFAEIELDDLRAIGFRAILDLRSKGERDRDPHGWQQDACCWLHLDINTDLRAADRAEWDRLRHDPDPATSRMVMTQNYAAMPASLLPHWRGVAETLLGDGVPAMINCTAGKDRTGVAVALLLALAGVEHSAIEADYLKSDIFGANMALQGSIEHGFMESFGFVPNKHVIDALIGVDLDYLAAALDRVRDEWGGVFNYFEAAGLSPTMQNDLRMLLVTRGS